MKRVIDKSRELLKLPGDYHLGIVPGSDTGAFEMALWSMLGARGVDVLAWESFGKVWLTDIAAHLNLKDVRTLDAPFGQLPGLARADFRRDVVFTWNGTTSGVRVPNGDWIRDDREGLTFIDATSAIFAEAIDWRKADVLTYSWQKALGGEGAHGVLVLSPRAVERLERYTPPWPLPKLFRLTKAGKLDTAIFSGETINTPSMLCVEDCLDALAWAESAGGLDGLIARTRQNARVIYDWIDATPWLEALAVDKTCRSNTSICMRISGPAVAGLSEETRAHIARTMVAILKDEGVAFDIASYRDAPVGLRIWTGPTIEASDLEALIPWLEWAFADARGA